MEHEVGRPFFDAVVRQAPVNYLNSLKPNIASRIRSISSFHIEYFWEKNDLQMRSIISLEWGRFRSNPKSIDRSSKASRSPSEIDHDHSGTDFEKFTRYVVLAS